MLTLFNTCPCFFHTFYSNLGDNNSLILKAMEEKLVTLAIHTYERATILKGILESEGIETYLHNVNLIQPVISAGVRVRIKETDLPAALRIIENIDFNEDESIDSDNQEKSLTVLVPVDFSDFTMKAAKFAFNMAENIGGNIVFLHTYYSPFYTGGMPVSDAFAFDEGNSETLRMHSKKMHEDMEELTAQLLNDIHDGKLPDIDFICKFREGVPEEQILQYSKKHKPFIIIMGTQGKHSKDHDLLGSVTSDIIDRSRTPVFAFPVNTPFDDFSQIKKIGFVTSFDQRDLLAFDSMVKLLKGFGYKVYFIHFSNDESNQMDEVRLTGIKEYFKKQYPELESSYCVIKGNDIIDSLNDFISERQIDAITITAQKRNLFSRLFNPSLAHKVLFHTDTALFVFRG